MAKQKNPAALIGGIVTGLAALSAGAYCADRLCRRMSRASADGVFVELSTGGRMHLVSQGTGETTIVFLSGLGTPSPAIDFMPLIARLRGRYRCVVPEGFGYGYSDLTSAPRTVDNIVEETREALHLCGIHPPYVLLGHSIAGLYMQYWAAMYPEEVQAVIGEDTSVPPQCDKLPQRHVPVALSVFNRLGLPRLFCALGGKKRLAAFCGGDPRRLSTVRMLAGNNLGSRPILDEQQRVRENCLFASAFPYPASCKLLLFVASELVELCKKHDFNWLAEHQRMVLAVDEGRCVELSGGHYLHRTRAREMVREINDFLFPTDESDEALRRARASFSRVIGKAIRK